MTSVKYYVSKCLLGALLLFSLSACTAQPVPNAGDYAYYTRGTSSDSSLSMEDF